MIRTFIFSGLVMAFSAGMVFADVVPMVDRHIFLPEISADKKEDLQAAPVATGSAVEKEILFSGILVTPKGKQAILSENTKNDKKQKRVYNEGDPIKGMTVKEIGSNYVLIANKESTVRLNLYKGAKTRPAPLPDPVNVATQPSGSNPQISHKPGMTADANPQGGDKNDPKSGQKTPAEKEAAPSPFGGGNRGEKPVQNDSGSGAGAVNPFAEILKGADRNKSGDAAGGMPFNLPAAN